MSTQQSKSYAGRQEYDLSTTRSAEEDYLLIQAPKATTLNVESSDSEAYLHFGSKQNSGFSTYEYTKFDTTGGPFGQIYLEVPSGATGTLTLTFGVDMVPDTDLTIDTVESINGTVTTDVTDDITRSVGVVRQEQASSLTAFQHTTTSTSAEQLAANAVATTGAVTVQADPDNAGDVFLGNATNQVVQLSPGDSISGIAVSNTDLLYVNADNSGDAVNVVAEA